MGGVVEGDSAKHDDVFRKSFDAIFFVAPPVLSDAAAFFNLKLKEALCGRLEEGEAYRAYKIFDLSRADEVATPRQIIAFINAVALLWEQWSARIPIATIAVYTALRDKIDKAPSILRKEDSIDGRYRDLADDSDLFQNLAALAFNVEPDLALQVLLHSKVEQTFTSNDVDTVQEVVRAPGFFIILPEVYTEHAMEWAESSLTLFQNAVRNLVILEADAPNKLESRRRLLDAFDRLRAVPPTEWEHASDLLTLYQLCSEQEAQRLTMAIVAWLHRSLPEGENERNFSQGRLWIAFVGELFDALEAQFGADKAHSFLAPIRFPEGDEFLLGVAYDADTTKIRVKELSNAQAGDGLISSLDNRIIERPIEFYYAWPEIRHLVDRNHIVGFFEKSAAYLMQTKLTASPSTGGQVAINLNMLFEESDKKDSVAKSRKNLVSNGALYHAIYGLRESDESAAARVRAAALWTILDQIKQGDLPSGDVQGHAFGDLTEAREYVRTILVEGEVGDAVLGFIANWGSAYNKLSDWIEWAAAEPDSTGLLQAAINMVVEKQDFAPPPVKTLVVNYDFVKQLLDTNTNRLMAVVGAHRDVEEYKQLDLAALPISLVAKRDEPGWKALCVEVDTWLQDQDSAAWREALSNDGHMVRVLRCRARDSRLTVPPNALREPVAEHVLAVFSGEIEGKEGLGAIIDALPRNTRGGLAADVLERLERTVVTPAGFDSAIRSLPDLVASLPFEKRPDVTARKIVLSALQRNSETTRDFLEKQKARLRKALKAADEPLIGEIQEFIGEADDTDETGVADKRRIREILGLPSLKRSPPVADSADQADHDPR